LPAILGHAYQVDFNVWLCAGSLEWCASLLQAVRKATRS
jgi:hypothetical protein